MKRTVCGLVALLAGIVPAKSQTVPGQPAAGVSNTVQWAMKLTLTQPWKDCTIPLLIPASPDAPGRIENLKAKRATYEITPEPGQRQDPSLLGHSSVGRSSWEDMPLHVVAAEDPYAGKTFIIQDYSRAVFSGPPVYVSRTSGMMGMAVEPDGPLVWIESDFEMAGSSGKLEAAIRRFETESDVRKLLEKRAKMRTSVWVKDARGKAYERYVANPTRINLAAAAPYLFFHSLMPGDNIMVLPQIEGLEIIKDILRLDVRNPVRQKVASFWIDLEARKVIRCVADPVGPAVDPPQFSDNPWGRNKESGLIRVVIPALAHAEGRTELVKAERALYDDGRVILAVLAVKDSCAGRAFLSLAVHKGIYVLRSSGVTAVSIHGGGGLAWRESYVEPADSGKLEAALKRIEAAHGELHNQTFLKFRDAHWMNLASAAPPDFFFGPETRVSFYSPVIEKAEMTNNILQLGVRNPVTQKVADFWIDLEACKVIKCAADGKELDLSIDRSGLPVPPENESKPGRK